MEFLLSLFTVFTLLISQLPAHAASKVDPADFSCTGEICAYDVSTEEYQRSCGLIGDLNQLSPNEFLSFTAMVEYSGTQPLDVTNMYVRVDGGEKWGWASFTMEPGYRARFHVYYSNMRKCGSVGAHTLDWYVNDVKVYSCSLTITKETSWSDVLPLPTQSQITARNDANSPRAPFIGTWLQMPTGVEYTQYAIDFRASELPQGTYCCLGQWGMDLTSLKRSLSNIHSNYDVLVSTHAYAGFQRLSGSRENVAIMSFWDLFGTDQSGREQVVRAKLVYPADDGGNGEFGGEGTGAHILVPYAWEADHWYRMLLRAFEGSNGNTWVQQWVCDLESGEWTLLSCYDTLLQDSAFTGDIAVFMENFYPQYAGEVRTMEICNARILRADTNKWVSINTAYINSNGGLPKYEGAYAFGAQGNSFWMISTGVGGDWYGNGKGQGGSTFTVKGGESGAPYTRTPW